MVEDRGGDVLTAMIDSDIVSLSSESSTFAAEVNPDITVVFHTSYQSVKKTDVFGLAGGAAHIILVINTKGTAGSKPNIATVKSLDQEARSRGVGLEIWTLRECQYNVTEHDLVPKHVRLAASEAEEVLEKLCVKNRFLLPTILSTDPVARYLALQPGDVVRIERPSPTTGQSIAYRCCRKS